VDSEHTANKLPDVIRLPYAGTCACGEKVAEGERVGYRWTRAQVVCLHCMARLQARRVDPAQLRHSELVAERANGLVARLIAIRALGTLASELQAVDALADEPSGARTAS
jgi:hypothetical protein